jgi:hypothetical protein
MRQNTAISRYTYPLCTMHICSELARGARVLAGRCVEMIMGIDRLALCALLLLSSRFVCGTSSASGVAPAASVSPSPPSQSESHRQQSRCQAARQYQNSCFHCSTNKSSLCASVGSTAAGNLEGCCSACADTPGCDLWTFQPGMAETDCFLKHRAVHDPVPLPCAKATSGVMPPPAAAPPPPAPTPLPRGTTARDFKNVLFIAVDDLRPEIGAYGHSYMHTPHIDKLAAESTVFT